MFTEVLCNVINFPFNYQPTVFDRIVLGDFIDTVLSKSSGLNCAFWHEVFVCLGLGNVDDVSFTIFVRLRKLIIGPCDLAGFNHVAVRIDVIFHAKFYAFLGV